MRLHDERYEELKQLVTHTFEKYDVCSVPIDVFELANKIKAEVHTYGEQTKDVRKQCLAVSKDGFSILNDSKWYIFYNDNANKKRINQTIMHEISHILLDHIESTDETESEAKFCAKFALAPPILVSRLKCSSPADIQTYFNISDEASTNAWEYYQNWLRVPGGLKPYEKKLENLFYKDIKSKIKIV